MQPSLLPGGAERTEGRTGLPWLRQGPRIYGVPLPRVQHDLPDACQPLLGGRSISANPE